MHNIKDIRKDFALFAKSLEKRSLKINFENLRDLDEQNRQLIQEKEALEKEKKDISKSKDEALFKRSKEISSDLEKVSDKQKKVKIELENILSNIPNIPHPDVPEGKDENDNVEILSFESTGLSTSLPIQLEAKVNEYLSLVMKLIFAFGLSFQLPVVLSLLARVGYC
jgi:seryl-tRNA synthetase